MTDEAARLVVHQSNTVLASVQSAQGHLAKENAIPLPEPKRRIAHVPADFGSSGTAL
jgi:hypothetical protein